MNNKSIDSGRNQSLDICKLIASLFIVFLHVPFPDPIGSTIDCFSHFAVPFFFLVSGYFNYHADSRTVFKRFLHILKLNLIASLFYLLWYSLVSLSIGRSILTYLGSVFTANTLQDWLLFNLNPLSGHLWYLSSVLYCYFILWIYTRFFSRKHINYLPLYLLGVCALFFTLALDGPISTFIIYIPYYFYRNAWFLGISLFILGIFLHEYYNKIVTVFHLTTAKLVVVIMAGLLLSIIQKYTIGMAEISFGSILTAAGLMLLCLAHPALQVRTPGIGKVISRTGFYSTIIYIVHLAVIDLYTTWFQIPASDLLGSTESFARPFIIFLLSLLISILCDKISTKWNAIRPSRESKIH